MNKDQNIQAEKPEYTLKELRDFGLIMAGMLCLMFGLVLPWIFGYSIPYWPFILAFVFAIVALLQPVLLGPVNSVWLKISNVLGWINTRLVMGIMFFLLIAPIGIIMRLLGKDTLANKLSEQETSYRVITKVRDKKHLEKPF